MFTILALALLSIGGLKYQPQYFLGESELDVYDKRGSKDKNINSKTLPLHVLNFSGKGKNGK